MRFCKAQRGRGPAFLQAGPHQLLQRADLPWSRTATQGVGDPALRPQANGFPGTRSIGKHRHAFRVVSSSGQDPQDLLHAAGREYTGATHKGRPPPIREGRRAEDRVDLRQKTAEGRAGLDVLREADRLVLAEHGPPGAIIDDAMNIVQVRGRTAPYLELSPGEPTQNLLKLAREGLIAGLGKAIQTARQTNAVAKEDGFRIEGGGRLRDVTIKVIPFRGSSSSKERYFLVQFEDAEPNGGPDAMPKPAIEDNGGSARLRREFAATKEYLRSIVADNATTLEELRAANEEAQ